MEALTAVAVAALTIYDMVKAVDKTMVIGDIRLEYKSGGKSEKYTRQEGRKAGRQEFKGGRLEGRKGRQQGRKARQEGTARR